MLREHRHSSPKRVRHSQSRGNAHGYFSLIPDPLACSQGHGLASGVGLLAGGIVGGAAALVACPVYGAKEGGAKGFAKGLGQGALAAVGLPVGGAVAGLTQLTRGAVQTPKAIWNSSRGKTWSRKTRSWITYSLPEEMAQLQEEEKEIQVSCHCEASVKVVRVDM